MCLNTSESRENFLGFAGEKGGLFLGLFTSFIKDEELLKHVNSYIYKVIFDILESIKAGKIDRITARSIFLQEMRSLFIVFLILILILIKISF